MFIGKNVLHWVQMSLYINTSTSIYYNNLTNKVIINENVGYFRLTLISSTLQTFLGDHKCFEMFAIDNHLIAV